MVERRAIDTPSSRRPETRLLIAALLVPVLVAAGVAWLRHMPDRAAGRAPQGIMHVDLVRAAAPSQAAKPVPPPAPHQPSTVQPNAAARPSERPTPTPVPKQVAQLPPVPARIATAATTLSSLPPSPTAIQAQTSSAVLNFQKSLQDQVKRFQHYPEEARGQRLRGTVQVRFAMGRGGIVLNAWVQTSSGYAVLDRAAVETVLRAQPLPRIPAELPDRMEVLLPVEFSVP